MQLKSLEGVMDMMEMGYEYGKREDERGGFDALEQLRREANN